jgi:hypothetical protein
LPAKQRGAKDTRPITGSLKPRTPRSPSEDAKQDDATKEGNDESTAIIRLPRRGRPGFHPAGQMDLKPQRVRKTTLINTGVVGTDGDRARLSLGFKTNSHQQISRLRSSTHPCERKRRVIQGTRTTTNSSRPPTR